MTKDFYIGRRLSYDESLCTVRFHGRLTGTKGEWIGVEWDDASRGKHNGIHQGQQIFTCRSQSETAASFVRPTRKQDVERTVLEAIRFKYCSGISNDPDEKSEAIVISGKVAEEIGFAKIAQEQAQLADLRVVLLDQLVVNGITPRDATESAVLQAQQELADACPNISELDIGFNTIERWQDIADICSALPKLKILRTGGLRFRALDHLTDPVARTHLRELDLEECLLDTDSIAEILCDASITSDLEELRLSGNGLERLFTASHVSSLSPRNLKSLVLDRNRFQDLDCINAISSMFPNVVSLSLQANRISKPGQSVSASKHCFPHINALNLADNDIKSYDFLNTIPHLFPNLSSLQLTGNPLFQQADATLPDDARASEKSYYLTLARIPSLKTLNYAKISARDRHEGELYYLSIAEKEIRGLLTFGQDAADFRAEVAKLHPLYEKLAKKYERESVIESLTTPADITDRTEAANEAETPSEPVYPIGSLGARLVKGMFYIQQSAPQAVSDRVVGQKVSKVTIELPSSIPVKQVMAILLRHPNFRDHLRPLQFDLVLESNELDPVDTTTESSTRSAMYGKKLTAEEKRDLWKEWGDWDADSLVERASMQGLESNVLDSSSKAEQWSEDGTFCIRDGRKWKRREVNIPRSLKRAWGDWLENTREATIRIVPFNS